MMVGAFVRVTHVVIALALIFVCGCDEDAPPPSGLTYATNPAVFTKGRAIDANVPSNGGGAVSAYAISPTLPAGLALDPGTGILAGTPSALAPRADFTVTGTGPAGATTATLTITVNDEPPTALMYATNPAIYAQGQAIASNAPSSAGGAVVAYAIDPALPAGLALDATTGVISGTPTVLQAATAYMVTATNTGGAATVSLMLAVTVDVDPPTGLAYTTNPAIYTRGNAIANNAPSSGGGPVAIYAIAPALPAGLSLDPATGVIAGTPTVVAATASYTVTAMNSGGQTTVALAITVNDIAPSTLVYATNPAVYTRGTAIAANAPSTSGGAVVGYTVAPALPVGLGLDPATGIISGTPTVQTAQAVYMVTATNSGGQTTAAVTITVVEPAPAGLTYSANPVVYTKGIAIGNNTPSSNGGAIASYVINPALPAGLVLDPSTGVITGTPSVLAPTAAYVVTATNSGGTAMVSVTITVNDVAPSALTYATNPASYPVNQAIANNAPSSSGGPVVSYTINPPLPAGLAFSTVTGVITGTPTTASPATGYLVIATNSGGSAMTTVTITVTNAPTNLTYATNPAVYRRGQAIANNTPASGGGAPTSYAINPALPAGLAFDTGTGVISGTPTAVSPATGYTVTATNLGGSAMATVTITVTEVPPSALTYSTNPAVYPKNQTIANNTPSSSGGPVASYAISPALPTGLAFSTVTGVVSGTPSVATLQADYTVTATNSGGQTTVALTITVTDTPPANLTYSTNPATYVKGTTITSNNPSYSGGFVTSWSITPALPTGLSISGSTGRISGTPQVAAPMRIHTVTATNSGGSTQANVTITVNDLAPANLAYSTNPAVYARTQLVPNNMPSFTGGTPTSYMIAPALPTGLAIGPMTGIIGGTPMVLSGPTNYTVTATNSGGSTAATVNITVIDPLPHTIGTAGAIAAGNDHSCAVVDAGARCWGSNAYGQLGDDTTTSTIAPVAVVGLTGVQAVTAGTHHSCAIVDGRAVCWGRNTYGQLGNGTTTDSDAPVQVTGLTSRVQAIAAGANFTCALVDGGVRCWGINSYGQLGDNTTTSSGVPIQVIAFPSGVQAIAAGDGHVCALSSGAARCWGDNASGQLGDGTTTASLAPVQVSGLATGVQVIAARYHDTCAIRDGGVVCWGLNSSGQLGDGSTATSSVPVQVTGFTSGAQAIALGEGHACGIRNGGVACWGLNFVGELGDGTQTNRPTPVAVSGLTGGGQAITAGGNHTCALVNGGIRCWGYLPGEGNKYTPTQVAGLTSGVQGLEGGGEHTCAIVNGGARCWGANAYGNLGNGTTTQSSYAVQVTGLSIGVQMLGLGLSHSCAIVNGGVQCWGLNSSGVLGNGTTTQSSVPVEVTGLTSGAQAIAAGESHSCAIVNGGVWCWGQNTSGQLGNGTTTNSTVPVQVSGLANGVTAIAVGQLHTCAIASAGDVQCWGFRAGAGATDTSTPVAVAGLASGVQAITAGLRHSCAVVDGGAQCWGQNFNGALGNNTTMESSVPVQVIGLTNGVRAMTGGNLHTCAQVDGGALCWGHNGFGQLGDDRIFTNSNVPVQVVGLTTGVQSVTASYSHNCAMVDGRIKCWGRNTFGNLGIGSTTPDFYDVPVAFVPTWP